MGCGEKLTVRKTLTVHRVYTSHFILASTQLGKLKQSFSHVGLTVSCATGKENKLTWMRPGQMALTLTF